MKAHVLVVDDDAHVLKALNRTLSLENNVYTAKNSEEAFRIMEEKDIDVIISDYRLEGEIGSDLLKNVYTRWPYITRITITGFKHLEIIEDSINKASIFRFLSKPWDNEELLSVVRDAKKRTDILRENVKTLASIKKQEDSINLEINSLKNKLNIVDRDLFDKTEKFENLKDKLENIYDLLEDFSNTSDLTGFKSYLLDHLRNLIQADTIEILEDCNDHNIVSPLIINKPYIAKHSFLDANLKSSLLYPINVSVYKKNISWLLILGRNDSLFAHKDIKNLEDLISITKLVLEWRLTFDYVKIGEEQWRNIFDVIKDPIVISDSEGNPIKQNTSAKKQQGDASVSEAFDNDNYEKTEYKINAGNITERVSFFRDLKNEQELYRQLIQSEKLSAIGMLASNIAHELNNPIGGIMAYSQLIKNDENFTDLKEELTEIENACKRSKDIVYNLLDFSSDNKRREKKTLKLSELVNSTLPLLNVCLKGYKFSTNISDNIEIYCNIGEIQQILFNLIVNATHATPVGGEITVSGFQDDKYVSFSVQDTGSGIPDNIKEKIFDSFFTTKEKSKGTGLGLSVAKSIVEEHGGYIDLETEQGKGTSFTVSLPRT